MKKIFAIILILCMLPMAALACEEDMPIVKIETSSAYYAGCAWMALDETRHIVGKWDASAQEETFTAPDKENPFILGLLDNGVVRAKGELKYFTAAGRICGLTKVACTVEIRAEYAQAVSEIVENRVECKEVNAAAVIAATQWRTAGTIYHVFFLPSAAKAPVGVVRLNGGSSAATLYMGEFEGALVLGFVTGGVPAREPEPEEDPEEPETEPEPEPVVIVQNVYIRQESTTTNCTRIIQDNRQININSIVENHQKQIVKIGTGCGGMRCLEY